MACCSGCFRSNQPVNASTKYSEVSGKLYGPYLRFGGYDVATHNIRFSVLVVCHASVAPTAPQIVCSTTKPSQVTWPAVKGFALAKQGDFSFWRFNIQAKCGAFAQHVCYEVHTGQAGNKFPSLPTSTFVIPSNTAPWQWAFYSCNGYSSDEEAQKSGGITTLWLDVLAEHAASPFHVMVGGGDQIYNDMVWDVPALKTWLSIRSREQRVSSPFTPEMVKQVTDFYFGHYLSHFAEPGFKDALASIPQVMLWDDHDIFDGWGSYPPDLQQCPVFQGVFEVAQRFYLLFQHHATAKRIRDLNGSFGSQGFHLLHQLGPSTAFLGLDCRTERHLDHVVSPASWVMIRDKLVSLPRTVRHLVVVTTVPVVYPRIGMVENALMGMSEYHKGKARGNFLSALFNKSGLASMLLSQFGEPDLLDDLLDQWTSPRHREEKRVIIQDLQELALQLGIRVTFLSGDVHCAGVGQLCSSQQTAPDRDHRLMYQIISSAIGNNPPPSVVVSLLQNADKVIKVGEETEEQMLPVFDGACKLRGVRNWCEVSQAEPDGEMRFSLRLEPRKGKAMEVFEMTVPPLNSRHHTGWD